ncbi:MAG TPA: stage III sporulation protein AG [Lachnospiraceae bacterium]|nr:stage III sporulation protein AG [Lachnospiraceae bacterium]
MKTEWKQKLTLFFRSRKKEQVVTVLLIAALAVVIFLPASDTGKEKASGSQKDPVDTAPETVRAESDTEQLRHRMEDELGDILSKVEGVGSVQVAITLETTGKKTVEKDVPDSSSSLSATTGDGAQESTSAATEEKTVYTTESDGAQVPYVVSETLPQVRGVLVIAEGGGDPVIIEEIQEAVMALFHLEAHKIKVMKKK